MPLKDIDIAWIAGFYEGEGSVGCYETRPNQWSLTISVTQKNPASLGEIQRLTGLGKIYYGKEGCRWSCYYKNARDFMELIRPFMKDPIKIKQMSKALKESKRLIKHGSLTGLPTNSKLGFDDVKKIRSLYPEIKQSVIATMFNICQPSVSKIVSKKEWRLV